MEPGGADGAGWMRPGRRRRRRRKEGTEEEEAAAERERRRLKEAEWELRGSPFWERSLGTIVRALGDHLPSGQEASGAADQRLAAVPPAGRALEPGPRGQEGPESARAPGGPLQCVCYGLGSFSSCVKGRYQLAFLLLLLQELQIPRPRCHVFDPVFSELEMEILRSLGLTVILENEEGKRAVDAPTLFYMVHCGKALYNNLLWRNWSPEGLASMAIVGNSFRGMEERVPARILQQEYAYIAQIVGAASEAPLPSHPQYLDVFNDTAIHWFPPSKLRGLPPGLWECPEEPSYQDDDQAEIIRNSR